MSSMKQSFLGILAFSALVLTTTTVVASDVVRSIQHDLTYDENGKLVSHHMVYPAGNPKCAAARHDPTTYGYEFHPIAGEALAAVFPGAAETDCRAACLARGTDRSVAHAAIPQRQWAAGQGSFDTWFLTNCHAVEVCLLNYHSRSTPIKIYWISDEGDRKLHLEIEYGERGTRCFTSYLGHKFEAEDGDTGEHLESLQIEYTMTKAIGISPPSGNPKYHNFDAEIKTTLTHEWKRHNRVKRTFSTLGFKKGRLPDDMFASMGSFYYNNRYNKVREEWDGKGVFVNWWETDCSFIQIPWQLKGIWQQRLRELVEVWAGVPVEQTDMYGLRQYEAGARLLTHVDRESTHAVSLIVNIAQGNLTEPWPVEVNDHGDRLHEVIMEPGDIVYYESAKCLHGRNRPLTGPDAFYTNLFTHYRPIGDPKWFEKPNDAGAPDPVVQVEGDCRLEKIATTKTANNQLGLVEAVKCDDPRLGPHISPSLFKAKGPADLIEWWKMTSPHKETPSNTGRDEL